jgi:hypothetical protein
MVIVSVITGNVDIANSVDQVKLGCPKLLGILLFIGSPDEMGRGSLKAIYCVRLYNIKPAFKGIGPIIPTVVLH